MKILLILIVFPFIALTAFAQKNSTKNPFADSVKLIVDANNAYYQKTVKIDSVTEAKIYQRALQFIAARNFMQNYGYQQDGKLICTTTQDLNVNDNYVGDEDETVDPYTVQFSLVIDMKNGAYRYTVSNILLYLPTDAGNKRLTFYDEYLKATSPDASRHINRDAKKLIDSFERYLSAFTGELHAAIQQKLAIYNPKF